MKRLSVILCSFLFVFFMIFTTARLDALSVAVIPVEPLGVDKNVAMITTELIQGELSSRGVFELVEREKLDAILKEQELQISDITNKEKAIRIGSLLNVEKILFGTIGLYSSSYLKYFLSLRLVDVEEGTIDAVANTGITSDDELQQGVSRVVEKLISNIRFTGRVKKVEGQVVYTSYGSTMGAKKGMNLAVYKILPIRDESGKIFMNDRVPVANIVVESSTENGSRCTVVESGGSIEPGFLVERGKADLGSKRAGGASITVRSIPENAKVFLNSQFLGVTPLSKKNVEPGRYSIEIRAPGYRVYAGKLTLGSGKNVVIERELEPVLELEDMLLLGKVPKRKTDPFKAAKLALIPGLGESYVGYDTTAVAFPFAIFSNVSLGLIYYNNMLERGASAADEYDIQLSKDYLGETIIYSATALVTYLYSIMDSALQAGSDFLYPVPVEVYFGASGGYTVQRELGNETLSDDASSLYYLGDASITVRSRPLYLSVGLQFSQYPLWILFHSVIRYPIFERLYVGVGTGLYVNMQEPSNVEKTELSTIKPLPGDFVSPELMLSYEGNLVEGDITIAPLAFGRGWVITQPASSNWTETIYTGGLAGYIAGLKLSYYLNLKFGISAGITYVHMKNADSNLENSNAARINELTYIDGYAGLVFRF